MFITNDKEYKAARDQIVEFAMRARESVTTVEIERMEELMVELEIYVQTTYEAPTVLHEIAMLPTEKQRQERLNAWIASMISPTRLN